MNPVLQRVVGILVLLVTGALSLPVSAYFLDDRGTENYIVPVQLGIMALIGAGVVVTLPAMAREGAPARRRALSGVWMGLFAAVVGVLVSWLAISGLRGA